MESNGFKRRNLRGEKMALRNGGWMRFQTTIENIGLVEKRRRLEEEIRQEKGIDPEASVFDALDLREAWTLNYRCLLGEVITEWGGFDLDENGEEVPCYRDGVLDEEQGLVIMHSPGVAQDVYERIKEVDERYARRLEVLGKNLPAPSPGDSATEGASPTTQN